MKKGNLIWFSSFAGFAILGLLTIQIYWMKNAISVKEERFNQQVGEAMYKVAYKAEKHNMMLRMNKVLQIHRQSLPNKIQFAGYQHEHKHKGSKKFSIHISPDSLTRVTIVKKGTPDSICCDPECNVLCPVPGNINDVVVGCNTNTDAGTVNNTSWIDHRNDMMNSIISEMNYHGKAMNNPDLDHVEQKFIDSVLRKEFDARGIRTDFTFDIIHPNQENYRGGKKSSTYQVALAPENILAPPKFLSVFFPEKQTYLLKSSWMMLSASLLLVLVLISSFYYFVNTIIQQKKLSVMKNDFINNMTHEFKTPISTINLACEVLGDGTIEKPKEKTDRYIGVINEENKRLGNLVENILQTAILDKGDFTLQTMEVDLHQLIRQATGNVQLQIEQRQGSISQQLDAGDSIIQGDRIHLTNVIYNLLDNAVKYTIEAPELLLRTKNTKEGIELTVQDNGIGISKEYQKKIFEKLFRVPTGNIHNVKGFGLGLSYVKAIVEKHGGTVSVDSESGKGSTFRIYLPKYKTV